MVMLEAMTLQPSETIYDAHSGNLKGNFFILATEINQRISYAA